MRRGVSLAEMMVVLTLAGVLLSLMGPRLGDMLDRVAVRRAADEITTGLSITRHRAISYGTLARLSIAADSLRADTLGGAWGRWRSWSGPGDRAVGLTVSNPVIVFAGNGLTWGVSNTRVVLARGGHSAMITISRVGRVKRW